MVIEFSGDDANTVKAVFEIINDDPVVKKLVIEGLAREDFDDPTCALDWVQAVINNAY